ncbi:MAG: BsuPI-related putative proteinase inhibitor [Halolamina sp.]|uniref:BsuPI-related putative proteinase inhibitor n=1 Tax=Halolamina sp. TaxID=1940283 RepID=UPI002FC38C34
MLETTIDAEPGDDAVAFSLRVENRGDDDVALSFSDSQRVRISVFSAENDAAEPIWRSDEGQMFAQMLGSEPVPAGESVEFREEWVEPAPGTYRAVGDVVCRERELQDETTFSV